MSLWASHGLLGYIFCRLPAARVLRGPGTRVRDPAPGSSSAATRRSSAAAIPSGGGVACGSAPGQAAAAAPLAWLVRGLGTCCDRSGATCCARCGC
jgi:hypothetical protein